MRKNIILLAAGAVLAGSAAAYAAQTSDAFQSRINIQSSCVVTAADVDFGNVGVISGTETASSTVAINCSGGVPWTLSFDTLGTVTAYTGTMVNGAEDVAYSAALSGTSGTGPGSVSINAALPAQVTPPPALYTDNRTVYITY